MGLYLDRLRHVKPLLDGHDLVRLGVSEGPRVGELLEELRMARLEGLLETRDDEENLIAGALRSGTAGA